MTNHLKRLEHGFAREDYNQENRGLAQLCATPEGRQALWWLLGQCGTFQNAFDGNALTSAFASGQQSIGQLMLARLEEADPQAYMKALGENYDRVTSRDTARRSAAERDTAGDDGDYLTDFE